MDIYGGNVIFTKDDMLVHLAGMLQVDIDTPGLEEAAAEGLRNTHTYTRATVFGDITFLPSQTVYHIGRGVNRCTPQIKTYDARGQSTDEYVTLSWWEVMDDSLVVYSGLSGPGRVAYETAEQRFAPDTTLSRSMVEGDTEAWVSGTLHAVPPVGVFKAAGQWYTYAGKEYKQYVSTTPNATELGVATIGGELLDDTTLYETFEGNKRVLHTVLHNVRLNAGEHNRHGMSIGTDVAFGLVFPDMTVVDMAAYYAASSWCRMQINRCEDTETRTMYSQLMLDYRDQMKMLRATREVRKGQKLYKSEFKDPRRTGYHVW